MGSIPTSASKYMNNLYIGIDPGINNFAYTALFNGEAAHYSLSIKRNQHIVDFIHDIYESICTLIYDEIYTGYRGDVGKVIAVVEKQFDRGPGKRLEFIVNSIQVLMYSGMVSASTADDIYFNQLYIVHPSQVKKFVTGNGKAGEPEFWMKIKELSDCGKIPLGNNEHETESGIMALMAAALDGGVDWATKAQIDVCKKMAVAYP